MGKYGTPFGRWSGFGPYYAMFPVGFAKQVVDSMTPEGGSVLDPFCGRGTVPFVAQVSNRFSLGIDINPVAWIFAKVKTSPEPEPEKLMKRLENLKGLVRPSDKKTTIEFQKWAWSEKVLSFLNAARRELNWREDITDRTLMGFILVNLHGRPNDSISNQMQKSRAMGPDYAVRWWRERSMRPPDVDPYEYFRKRIKWRYMHGAINEMKPAEIARGDAAKILQTCQKKKFSLLFTSPPYFAITDYRQDNWIRLWMLGEGPPLPDWKRDEATRKRKLYKQMLDNVFFAASKLLKPHSAIWIRTDARKFTKDSTLETIRKIWPNRKLFIRYDSPEKQTQTVHFGNKPSNLGEIDLVMPGRRKNHLPLSISAWMQI